jgi:hypothetical protein
LETDDEFNESLQTVLIFIEALPTFEYLCVENAGWVIVMANHINPVGGV